MTKSEATKRREGAYVKNPDREPKPMVEVTDPLAGKPVCPRHLKGTAKTEWKRLVDLLTQRGTVSKADRMIIEAYCVTYQQWRDSLLRLGREGVVNIDGKRNPVDLHRSQCLSSMVTMLKEMKLTPASRKVEQVEAIEEVEDVEAFLKVTG